VNSEDDGTEDNEFKRRRILKKK